MMVNQLIDLMNKLNILMYWAMLVDELIDCYNNKGYLDILGVREVGLIN